MSALTLTADDRLRLRAAHPAVFAPNFWRRNGLFVLEADLPEADEYRVELAVSPEWQGPNDQRKLTVTLSMLRLVPQDDNVIS